MVALAIQCGTRPVSVGALDLAQQLLCPVLGLYGEADEGIPVATVREMEAKLKAHHKTAGLVVYPGAPHGFFADYRSTYRLEAAREAWKRALGWFGNYLKG